MMDAADDLQVVHPYKYDFDILCRKNGILNKQNGRYIQRPFVFLYIRIELSRDKMFIKN